MNLNDYDLIVFDVDGTLYFQNKLRMIMAMRLMKYYICHPLRLKDLFIIKDFRSIRDKASDTNGLYELTAKKNNVSRERAEEVIRRWIYENPMDAVRQTADAELISIIKKLQADGKKIAIWSDYEADDKLIALNLECDLVYTAEQERVGELKPSPKGLLLIMSDTNTPPEKILMVGDRLEKDGEAAKAAGCAYVILPKSPAKRHDIIGTLY